MQSRSKLILALIAFGAVLCSSGCIPRPHLLYPSAPVYVAPGQVVEVARPQRFRGWVTNAETGGRELRTVKAQAGWYVGRLPDSEEGDTQ